MPVKNYFPIFHKLKSGAYSYVWTDKCERLLPKHYKERCLEYMLREPKPVHWKPDTSKYVIDQYGTRLPVQNHPVRVKYPLQCNYGLWAGEGVVQNWSRTIKSKKQADLMIDRVARYSVPFLVNRVLYSEILDKWFQIPCTNRAMDLIDEAFGLDYYILKNHERDLNSKLAMDLKRKMLLQLCKDAENSKLTAERLKVFNRYKEFMIPEEEAEWVGLSIKEALEKAEAKTEAESLPPLKVLIEDQFLKELADYNEAEKEGKHGEGESELGMKKMTQQLNTSKQASKNWLKYFRRGKSA
ncbi:39S ribosomal protein L28, mitochondrial-like [Mercenaria mercenaria]|uniref:39S ribosomal protein L28, mitochondrial-like n=1 Tax=Mercenaria mercenaria TaxID=6596 RepID=UPI001E1DF7E4|nr:39S ribosomal protein L28, mitochondrial-like [Mercenaria mercenaria]